MSSPGSGPSSSLHNALLVAAFLATASLYLTGLGKVGLLGPDEPRYAFIARQMQSSGDWITPRLWTESDTQTPSLEPWFEKPPLLYWISGAGYALNLGPEKSARVPVAVLAALFLLLYWFAVHRLEDAASATCSTLILATSAGWLAFTQVAVTDIPLAVTFSAAVLLALLRIDGGPRWLVPLSGACFGLAILAKGLVPGVLVLPLLWFARQRWKEMLVAAGVALLVAAPWYLAMTVAHGSAFLTEFFVRHHFSRFSSDELKHVQPFWFYVPVLLGGLFPWISLVAGLRPSLWDRLPRRALAATFLFGLVFFSLSTNKLPGYILPLWPSMCVLLAIGLRAAPDAPRAMAVSGLLLSLSPVIAAILPQALLAGITSAEWGSLPWTYIAAALPFAFGARWVAQRGRLALAVGIVSIGAGLGVLYIQRNAYPVLDEIVSSRRLAMRIRPTARETCVENIRRSRRYGLDYYLGQPLPSCALSSAPIHLAESPGGLPRLKPVGEEP